MWRSLVEPIGKGFYFMVKEEAAPISKMQKLLEKNNVSPRLLAKGEKVEGKVLTKLADSLLVDLGAKAEGVIPLKELEDLENEPKEGDKIIAIVSQTENDSGLIILTLRKNQKEKVWESLQQGSDKGEIVDVKGVEANRGGLIVDYNGLRGFVPSAHLSTNAKDAIGKKISVKVLEANKNFNRLVFSEKEVVGETSPKIDLPFKISDVLNVTISKILPFGLLVTLTGGSEGLIHISEISWTRVENITESYKTGQEIKAKVISIDPATGRINLSIKQLEEDPWQTAAKKYRVGETFEKKVSRLTSYGAFVELEKGIEGLLHSSKIPYGRELKVGDSLKVSIDLFNTEQRRVALRLASEDATENNKEEKSAEKPKKEKATKKSKATKE